MVNNNNHSRNNPPQRQTGQQPPYQPSQSIIPRPQPSQPVQPQYTQHTQQQQSGQPSRISTSQQYPSQPNQPVQRPPQNGQPGQPRPPHGGNPLQNIDKRVLWIAGGLTTLGVFLCVAMVGFLLLVYIAQPRVAQGVRVAGIEIGGDTLDDAEAAIANGYAAQTLNLTDGERSWQVSLAELGITVDAKATLAAAENAPENSVIPPVYQIDFAQAQAKLISLSVEVNVPAVNGNPPTNGKSLDIPYVLDRLRIDLAGEIGDGTLDLPMIETEGEFDAEAEYTGVPVTHIVAAGEELGLISKKYNVSMEDIITLNNIENPDLLWIGQELVIPAPGVYTPSEEEAPPAPSTSGKAIVISTDSQRIYAYENGRMVRTHLVSTGTSRTPTVKGDYKIQYKFEADDMQGPDYFLPQVPWTMYFYQGYAIHGTYWHNSFGRPMSHGCVNLPVEEAKWFFQWAEVGTLVRVI